MNYLAFDLGAESGRVMLGTVEAGRVELEELHRFGTGYVRINGSLRINLLQIFEELKTGMKKAAARGVLIAGISTDSWGVDYVLLRGDEPFLTAPYHYRDLRVDPECSAVFNRVSREEVFARTGIQFMPINTLFQLEHDFRTDPARFDAADGFLCIADYFNYLLSGIRKGEESLASTTQMVDPVARDWAKPLLQNLGLPLPIFPELVPSGTPLGPVVKAIADETGVQNATVIATCSHDTGAAVAAVPAEGDHWAYLSSGTWSLLGVELPSPLLTEACHQLNFTNEAGYGGTTRLLKNLAGLWILQECRREWVAEGNVLDYDALTQAAATAPSLRSLIRPDDARFASAGGMTQKIRDFCCETGQPAPETPGEYVRCILESLALLYRKTVAEVESLTGKRIEKLHIVGGGSKNELLNQWSANAIRLPVHAGPSEGTAIGNILIQATALGEIGSIEALRSVVRASFPIKTHHPTDEAEWQNAYTRFENLSTH